MSKFITMKFVLYKKIKIKLEVSFEKISYFEVCFVAKNQNQVRGNLRIVSKFVTAKFVTFPFVSSTEWPN